MTQPDLFGGPVLDDRKHAEALSQWFTPHVLARRLVDFADLASDSHVLEPSAGDGAIVEALCNDDHRVVAIEIDPALITKLQEYSCIVNNSDFLPVAEYWRMRSPTLDAVIMNPPYENGADCDHVAAAMSIAPKVVALVRMVFLNSGERYRKIWTQGGLRKLAFLVSRPEFRLGGVRVGTARHDFCAFVWESGYHGKVEVEWWA